MPESWTGQLIGRMHNEKVTFDELAAEMGVGKSYISMILNGNRKPAKIQERMECALSSILDRRNSLSNNN